MNIAPDLDRLRFARLERLQTFKTSGCGKLAVTARKTAFSESEAIFKSCCGVSPTHSSPGITHVLRSEAVRAPPLKTNLTYRKNRPAPFTLSQCDADASRSLSTPNLAASFAAVRASWRRPRRNARMRRT